MLLLKIKKWVDDIIDFILCYKFIFNIKYTKSLTLTLMIFILKH